MTASSLDGDLSDLQRDALFISSSSLTDHVPIGKGKLMLWTHWALFRTNVLNNGRGTNDMYVAMVTWWGGARVCMSE